MVKIGMRTIKTGIGVVISSILGSVITGNPINPAVACIISIQDSVSGSLETGKNRIYGTVLGGVIGFLFTFYIPGNNLLSGIGVILTIYLCNVFKISSGTSIAAVTFLVIQLEFTVSQDALEHSIYRVFENAIGVMVGIGTNFYLARPNLFLALHTIFRQIDNSINRFLRFNLLENKSKYEVKDLELKINEMEKVYKRLLKEFDYSNESIELDKIQRGIKLCKAMYYHIKSLDLLENESSLNKDNYKLVKSIYKKDKIKLSMDEDNSPVFNYHLKEIIQDKQELKKLNKSITIKDNRLIERRY